MNAGLLPLALLCAALGLALFATPEPIAWGAVGVLACTALLTALAAQWLQVERFVWIGLWVSTAATALLVHVPRGLSKYWATLVAANVGLWLSFAASVGGSPVSVLLALPLVFLFLPGAWLRSKGVGIGVKVVASWIVAVSLLAGMVSMTPTPGYQPDHMS